MALLYPWATKEYLLWEMTIGQVVAYHNIGIEIKYGKGDDPDKPKSIATMSPRERKAAMEDARRIKSEMDSDKNKKMYREKYGDV